MRNKSGFHARSACSFANFLQDGCGGITGQDGNRLNHAASRLHFCTADDLVQRPVVAFHQNVRKQTRNQFQRRRRVKDHHRINAFERGEDFRAFAFGDDGTPFTFQWPNARIAVQSDDQHVTQFPRLLEDSNMSRVQHFKAAVGKNDAAAVAFLAAKPQNRFLKSEYYRVQGISMRTPIRVGAPPENPVYHACWGSGLPAGKPR
jgi:hypothetical protein